jgi:hypothetical protein
MRDLTALQVQVVMLLVTSSFQLKGLVVQFMTMSLSVETQAATRFMGQREMIPFMGSAGQIF